MSSTLLSVINCCSGQGAIQLKCDTIVDNICVSFIIIFGQRYISSISLNTGRGIFVKRSKIKGVRFAISRYGLRALGILYVDSSTSEWLGDPLNSWIGVIYSNDIKGLRIVQDVGYLKGLFFVANIFRVLNVSGLISIIRVRLQKRYLE